ncbi:hypothetical protein BH23PLA1_BH23PLA1_20910 [soil metagenome]
MFQRMAFVVAAALLAGSIATPAHAQWGHYGWGGWGSTGGSTVQGDVARGMGAFAIGSGQYNLDTAAARSIETDTRMRLNEYLWQSEQIRRQHNIQRAAANQARTTAALKEIERRISYEPSRTQIVNGDALNAILHQLSNPSIPGSILKDAADGMTLTPEQARAIPINFASKGVVISLHRLSAEDQWPGPLRGEGFAEQRQAYQQLVGEARELPDDQPIPAKIIDGCLAILQQMRAKAQQEFTGPTFAEAERFLKGQVGLLQMARDPAIADVLEKIREGLKEVEEVQLVNAIHFMQVFNVRFGPARNQEEEALYTQTLYPMMKQLRDQVGQQMGGEVPDTSAVAAAGGSPTEVFHGMDWDQLAGPPQN